MKTNIEQERQQRISEEFQASSALTRLVRTCLIRLKSRPSEYSNQHIKAREREYQSIDEKKEKHTKIAFIRTWDATGAASKKIDCQV